MPMQNKNVPALLLWLLPLVMVSACATKSEPLPPPVVGEKPRPLPLPSAIAEIEPPPSGHYTKLLTDRRESSRQQPEQQRGHVLVLHGHRLSPVDCGRGSRPFGRWRGRHPAPPACARCSPGRGRFARLTRRCATSRHRAGPHRAGSRGRWTAPAGPAPGPASRRL